MLQGLIAKPTDQPRVQVVVGICDCRPLNGIKESVSVEPDETCVEPFVDAERHPLVDGHWHAPDVLRGEALQGLIAEAAKPTDQPRVRVVVGIRDCRPLIGIK